MKRILVVMIGLLLAAVWVLPVAAATNPVVQSVYLYTPDNPVCKQVTLEVLPNLRAKYGAQLELNLLDISSGKGAAVYQTLAQKYNLPAGSQSGPVVLVGDKALSGLDDIRAHYDELLAAGIQAGGVKLPDVNGLKEALSEDTTQFGENTGNTISATDATANNLAVVILILMVGLVFWQVFRRDWRNIQIKQYHKNFVPQTARWIPWLVAIGLIISCYLSYVELTANTAFCGPLGDCNAVQRSDYARILGILPVGVLGVLGNLCILGGWTFRYYGPQKLRLLASWALAGFAAFGICFSIYLTFLEPFVIHATCAWCLGSALVMSMLFWLIFETTWERPFRKAKKKNPG